MSKKKTPKPRTVNRDRGIFVMLSAAELETIEAVIPADMSASTWCRLVLLRVARAGQDKQPITRSK